MIDSVRRSLSELLRDEGRKILSDHSRVLSHLKSSCPNDDREIDDLSFSLELGIPDRLLTAPDDQLSHQLEQLAVELTEKGSLDKARADWVIETWAFALGLMATPTILHSSELSGDPSEQKPQETNPESSPFPARGSKGTCLGCLFKFIYGMILLVVVAIMLIHLLGYSSLIIDAVMTGEW